MSSFGAFFSPDEDGPRVFTNVDDPIRKSVTEILYKMDADFEEIGSWQLDRRRRIVSGDDRHRA